MIAKQRSRWLPDRPRSDMQNTSQQWATREIRVVLADDHALFRSGLHELLEQHGVDVAGEAEDGASAVEVVRDTAPDVVLMDVNMPAMSGIEATKRIRAVAPTAQVVMLTVSPDEQDVEESIYAGACGYLLKDAPVDQILAAIRAAAAGESHLSPRIAANILEHVRTSPGRPDLPGEARAELTERETEVLRLIAEGKENPQIAEELFISVQTVKNHVSNILAKLEVENRVQAAVQAVHRRLL
jgi:DNA-binding NarL/FixJ family response regulator